MKRPSGNDPALAVEALRARGVEMPDPRQVFVDPAVDPARLAPGVVLHPGTRLLGAGTSIGPGSIIGAEAPTTVEDCRLAHGVQLRGGSFSGAVFLDGATMGSAAHVRPGTLLEEQAEAAHAVGFKQTILLPFVVTGSLVNLCDILVAGGTSRQDHTEIGSSYVHFNFTPHGDKATPSLIGDVPEGVLLERARIFLGGQGGLVGPARVAFGTVIPAGVVRRGDVDRPGRLAGSGAGRDIEEVPFTPGAYGAVDRIVRNNARYIGNLYALRAWYDRVRRRFLTADPWRRACLEGALALLDGAVRERIRRLAMVADAMPAAGDPVARLLPEDVQRRQRTLREKWPALRARLEGGPSEDVGAGPRERFLRRWNAAPPDGEYLTAVRALDASARGDVRAWLQAVAAFASYEEEEKPHDVEEER